MGFTALVLFCKKVPAPIKTFMMYAGIVLIGLWALKVFWLNPHDNKVAAQERAKVTDEIKADFEKRYKVAVKDLITQKNTLEDKVFDLERANQDLARSREVLVLSFNKTLSKIKQSEAVYHAEDRAVPDYLLGARLSDVSNAIECAKPANKGRAGCPDSQANPGPTP